MKRFLVLATAALLLLPAVATAQTVTLKLATIVGNDNPFTTSAMKFKEVAEAKSGGRIKVEVYPAGQLAKNEIVQLEGIQLGTVDVAAMSLPSIGGKFDPKMLATYPRADVNLQRIGDLLTYDLSALVAAAERAQSQVRR